MKMQCFKLRQAIPIWCICVHISEIVAGAEWLCDASNRCLAVLRVSRCARRWFIVSQRRCRCCYDFQELESVVRVTDNTELLPRCTSGEDYMLGLEMTFSRRVRSKRPDYSPPLVFGWRKGTTIVESERTDAPRVCARIIRC